MDVFTWKKKCQEMFVLYCVRRVTTLKAFPSPVQVATIHLMIDHSLVDDIHGHPTLLLCFIAYMSIVTLVSG